jgi:DNA-binding transcriptional MerR regulator
MTTNGSLLRIGELSKRTGVSAERLRAWERRYGLLRPTRSTGGLRLYTAADVDRVRLMQQHLANGLAAAEAANAASRAVAGEETAPPALAPAVLRDELTEALDGFDEPRAQAILDRLMGVSTLEALLEEVVLPYLRELGARWARGDASIAQEHFATAVLRGRLLGIARGWGVGIGPTAVLACLPGEHHDLGLIAFGLALRARGWRIIYLGPDTPIDTVDEVSRDIEPSLVVLCALSDERLQPHVAQLRGLAARQRLAIGGAAAASGVLESEGVVMLTGDPIAEAALVSTLARGDSTPDRRATKDAAP